MNIDILYPYAIYAGFFTLPLLIFFRYFYHKKPIYIYSSLKNILIVNNKDWSEFILFLLRSLTLLFLILAIARIRIPDKRSKIPVNGIDIILSLDVSGSMLDIAQDEKTKFDIAKEEAIKFIEKRENDSIGLVLFANNAVSRCPLTQDKNSLKELIIIDTQVGQIDPDGTVLSTSLLTAINRLKYSNSKSKIIILLTDGNPTLNDKNPDMVIELARKLNIKIYTIGIGDDKDSYIYNSFGNRVALVPGINTTLLKNISNNTGGSFFLAKEPQELEKIYNQIDQLEKTEYQAPVYSKYFEYFTLFLWLALFLFVLEILLTTLFWPSLG